MAGMLLVLIGFALLMAGSLMNAKSGQSKVAVVGLLGPIPFGFGNDKRLFFAALGIAVAVMLIWAFVRR